MKHIVLSILAHVDAGKTTLIESLLYTAGTIRRPGRVDKQTTVLDDDIQERERGITIYAKEAGFAWRDTGVQVIDTPGHADFSSEMERGLSAADLAVVIVSGLDGVQSHTKTIWRLLEAAGIPALVFVNKMDLARRSEEDLLADIQAQLSAAAVPLDPEQIALTDDALLEEWDQTGEISRDHIRTRVAARKLFPVFFGSALHHEGTAELLDALTDLAPERVYGPDLGGFVYKRDDAGVHVKVTGGVLEPRTKLEDLRFDQVKVFQGNRLVNAPAGGVPAGMTAVVTGTDLVPGDVFGAQAPVEGPKLVPSMAYEILVPEGAPDLGPVMARLSAQDPTLDIESDRRGIRIRLAGEVQKEVLTRRIRDLAGIDVGFSVGTPVYRETITAPVKGYGHFEPLRHYAEVHLRLEPAKPGSGITVESEVDTDTLSPRFQAQILSALRHKRHKGVLSGSDLTDVKITVTAGKGHLKHTEGGDFRQATNRAVRQALMTAREAGEMVLLEPMISFSIQCDSQFIGTVLYELEKRGASVQVQDDAITGSGPLRNLADFQNELRALTKGGGMLELGETQYEPSPDQDRILAEIDYDPVADLRNTPDSVFCAGGAGFTVPWDEAPEHMHIPLESERTAGYTPAGHRNSVVSEEEARKAFAAVSGRNKNEKKTVKPHKRRDMAMEQQDVTLHPPKPVCYVVDGYNIINSWSSLKTLPLHDARQELIRILSSYQGYLGCRMILVFDGWRVQDNPGSRNMRGALEVVYTRAGQTADAYIEKLVSVLRNEYQLHVATSDGLIQNSVLTKGARRISARELELAIERSAVIPEEYRQHGHD